MECLDEAAEREVDRIIASSREDAWWDLKQLEDAQKIITNNEHKKTTMLASLKRDAEQGDVKIQLILSQMYYYGESFARDILGDDYYVKLGEYITQDYKESVKWTRLAAEQGHAKAQTQLGMMYFSGEGVKRNKYIGYIWVEIAARNGYGQELRDSYVKGFFKEPKQLAKAQELVRECIKKNYKDCG